MNATSKLSSQNLGDAGAGLYAGLGDGGRLRDADWAAPGTGAPSPRTQVLHRWSLPIGGCSTGLVFQPLDGNPRHGVLALYINGRSEAHGTIEILERQGRWLVMPERAGASLPVRGSEARSNIAGTPDRRFIFFNTLRDGSVVTLVERRSDGGMPPN
jgi:hypothetical protein